jgi:hypothetical protein
LITIDVLTRKSIIFLTLAKNTKLKIIWNVLERLSDESDKEDDLLKSSLLLLESSLNKEVEHQQNIIFHQYSSLSSMISSFSVLEEDVLDFFFHFMCNVYLLCWFCNFFIFWFLCSFILHYKFRLKFTNFHFKNFGFHLCFNYFLMLFSIISALVFCWSRRILMRLRLKKVDFVT